MTKKLKKFLACIISVFCVAALGFAIGCADSSSSENEILTGAEERVYETDNVPINDPSCCEEGHMVQTLAASKVTESHQSHSSAISSSTTTLSSGNWYLSSDVRLNSYINVTGSVHLCLNGHTLTGGSNSVIVVNGGTLYLHDCQGSGKITGGIGSNIVWTTGGSSQSMGGGITVANGGTLHMYGGTITGNKAGAMGGGVIVAYNSNMIMYGGTISNNTGGWLGNGGVGVLGYFLMTGGTISGNSEPSSANGFGGGVSVSTEGSYAGTFEMTGGTISGNSSKQGAGVYAYTSTSLKITGGTISGNTASAEGGGIYALVNTTISGATITGNTTTISSSSYGGGGISVPYGTATISNCTITDNKASNGCGGGICVNSGCTATLSGCTITGNSAGKTGGGIYFSGTLKISGKMVVHSNTTSDIYLSSNQYVTLSGNLSSGSDVGVYFASSSQTQATASESSTSYYKSSYSYFFPDNKSGYFATYSSYVYFTNSGGYFEATFNLTSSSSSSTTRTYSDLASAVGTASAAYNSSTTVKVLKAVSVSSSVTIDSGTSVTFNTNGYKVTGSSYLFSVKGSLTISGSGTITGCSSSYGAIYVQSGGSLTISNGTLSGNYSSTYGGAVYLASSSASFTMSGGTIQNNTAQKGGAGIYLPSKATATFTGGTVYNNTVSGSANNIYLSSGATIKFNNTSGITASKLGVTAAGTSSSSVQITNAVSGMSSSYINKYIYADSCGCTCVKSNAIYFADSHDYEITGFDYVDGTSGCTATATNKCSYCGDSYTTSGMAVTYGFENGNAYRYVAGYEQFKEYFYSGALVLSGSVYTLYDNLSAAVDATVAGDTVYLLDDNNSSGTVTITKSVTIDLNGHAVGSGITASGATVTITDGLGGATVTGMLTGTFVLRGGTYSAASSGTSDYLLSILDWTDWSMVVCYVSGTDANATYTITEETTAKANAFIMVSYKASSVERHVYFDTTAGASSLAENCSTDSVLTLVVSVAGDVSVSASGCSITFETAGYTLTGSVTITAAEAVIDVAQGSITGTDSGDVTIAASGETVVKIAANGTITGNVTISASETDVEIASSGSIGGAVTFGTEGSGTGNAALTLSDNGSVGGITINCASATIEMGGGTVSGNITAKTGSSVLDLGGGKVEGDISVSGTAELLVEDSSDDKTGEVEGNVRSESGLVLHGGTYTCSSSVNGNYDVFDYVDWENSYVCNFVSKSDSAEKYIVTTGSKAENGGNAAVVSYAREDGTEVKVYFESLADAAVFAAGAETAGLAGSAGYTLTLIADIKLDANESLTVKSSLTLDLNGKTLDGSITVSGNYVTVVIVDNSAYGQDRGYNDGTVTGTISVTGTSSTLNITAGTYYHLPDSGYLPSCTAGEDSEGYLEKNYVAAVNTITDINGNEKRVYIVMTERTALEIAADAYSCTASYSDGNYKEDTESTRTYYIKLEDVLFDLSTTGGMIVICRDAVSEAEITLKNTDKASHENGILLVIDVNGHTIDVNLVVEADYVTCDETTGEEASRETAKGASLVITNNSTDADSPYAKVTGTITVEGLSKDYELEGPDDQDYTPWAVGVSLGSLESDSLDEQKLSSNTLEIEDTATLSADVVMSKSWATYAGVVEWSSSNTGVATVSTNWTDTSSGDDAADLKAKLSATVNAVGEGTADITATVTGKDANDKYTATVRITVLADSVVSVEVSCQDADDDGNVTIKLPEDTADTSENSATAALTATVTMSREGVSYVENITWTSLNTEVATVEAASDGTATAVVKGLKAGVTYVTATAGGVESDPIMVTVENTTVKDGDIYGKDENGEGTVAEGVYLLTGEVSFNGATFENEDDLSIVKRENVDGDYDYIITGTASTMTSGQATAFGGDAEENSSYVIFAITVPVGSSIYNASGSLLWTNENDNSPEDYYGVIMQVHSDVNNDRTYAVVDWSGGYVTYHIVFDYVNVDGSRDPYITSITLVPSETTFVVGSTDNSVTFRVIVTYSDNDNTKIPDDLVWYVNGSAAECGVITQTSEGMYSYTVGTTAADATICVKTGSGEGAVSSNTVTISVVENIPTISATIVISETTSTGTATTGYNDLLVGHDYNLSVDAKCGEGEAPSEDVIWTWTSGSGSVATVEYNETSEGYVLHALRAGIVQLTVTATLDESDTGGCTETVLYEAIVTLIVSEDPTAEPKAEEKEYTNSYNETLTFMNGVEPNDDLRVIINLESSIEDNMGYNFMELTGEDGTGTGVYGIVSGHVHHYTEPVWSYSDDGTVTLRFRCDCKALELDEDGRWVEYSLDVNGDYSSDEDKSVTKSVDTAEGKAVVTYGVSINIPKEEGDERDYAGPVEPYKTTIVIEAAVMVQFTDGDGNVVATLYFTDAATAIITAEELLGDSGLGYGSAVVTLLSDMAEDLEISSGKITVNLNGFDVEADPYKGTTGSIIVSDTAKVTIENVVDETDTEVLVHGESGGNVSGEIEADGAADIVAKGGTYADKDIAKYVDNVEYVVVYNSTDGTYSVVPATTVATGYEASVVTTYENDQGEDVTYMIYYESLDAALEIALDGDKVTVLQDTNLDEKGEVTDSDKSYVIDKDITLDVNGKTVNGSLDITADATIDLGGGTVRGGIEIGLDDDDTTTPHVEISLNGGTVDGNITVGRAEDSTLGVTSAGADVEMDLGGGKIYGDITVSGGSSLTMDDTDRLDDGENEDEKLSYGAGLVIGDISVDETSSLEVLGGSFSADIIDSVTSAGGDADETRVVFIGEGTYKDTEGTESGPERIYTVMDEDEAKENAVASRTYTNSLGEEITVYYENLDDLLEDLKSGDVVTILDDINITPEGGSVTIGGNGVTDITFDLNGHTITGSVEIADGTRTDIDLGGGTIEGDVTIGKGADVNIDLDAGTIGGDVTVGGGTSLSITDGSGTNEGKVTGSVVEDTSTPGAEVDADISIDAGTYGNDVLDCITEGRVMYVNSDENGNTYTVTTEEDAASRAGAAVTYDITEDDGTRTVTVYFEDPADAIEYAIEVSDGNRVYVDLYTPLVYDENDEGIVTGADDDIVIDLHGNGITGNITVSADSKLTIDDTDPRVYEGDIDDVGIVNGTITVQTADEAKAAGGDAEKDGELVINGGIYTDDIAPYIPEDEYVLILTTDDEKIVSGRLYEIVSEKEATDEAVVSVRVGEDKTVYYADVSTATEDIGTALEDNPDAEIFVTVWADNDEDDPFNITLPSGDITIDFNGNTLTGDIALGDDYGEGRATLTFTDSSMDDETGLGTGAFVGTVTGGEDAVVTLEGGTFNSDTFDEDEYCGTLAFGDIYEKAGGGEGDEKEETGDPVDSYVPVYSGSTFTVVPGSVASSYSVASVETGENIRYFTDIDDALGYAAENGGTIVLYSDVTANKVMEITADVVINLNGHSLVADVVIYADAEDDAMGEGASLLVVDILLDTGTSGGAGDTGDEEDEEPSVGRLRGTIIVVGTDEYEGDNPYGETLLLGYTPMDGDLTVIIASTENDADGNKLTDYVFSKLADGSDWYYGIVPAEKHVCDFDIPVWEYMDDGTVKLTFKCACGEFDDSFEECYLLTAVENEDGTVTFTAEAVINSNAHKGTYVYKETFTPVAKVNVGGKTLYFDDIEMAIEAAMNSGATLILMDDVSIGDITIEVDDETGASGVTIDLNGHDITGGTITVAADVTLEIEGEGYVNADITVETGAGMTVRGGTYNEDTYDAIAEYVVEGYVAVEGSNADGDTVYSVYEEGEAGQHAEASITREVNGETETTYYESLEDALNDLQSGDTLTLWSDVEGALVIDTTSVGDDPFEITVDLNGHDVQGGIDVEGNANTSLTIDDSSADGDRGDGKVVGGVFGAEDITINGGTFASGAAGGDVSGEEYDDASLRESVADGKVIFNNEDGSFSVVDKEVAEELAGAVVTWTDSEGEHTEYYEILQDAVSAAAGIEGATVILYGDNPSDITVPGDVTIDLNGQTEDGDVAVNAGATLTLTDSSEGGFGTVDGNIIIKITEAAEGGEVSSGEVILSGGTYDFGSFDDGTLNHVTLGTDEDGESLVAVYGDLETFFDDGGDETVSGTFTVMSEEKTHESGAVKVTITTKGDGDEKNLQDIYFKDIETAIEYASEMGGKVTLYGDASAEDVIEITGNVEIDLNGHTLDADMVIDAVNNPEASLNVSDTSGGEGELKGTVTVILYDDALQDAYGDTFTVGGEVAIDDLDVSLKDGSADGEPAENFVFEGIDSDGGEVNDYYGISGNADGVHEHAYELVSMIYDEASCTVTIVVKCACGDVLVSETVEVTFKVDGTTGAIIGSAGIYEGDDDDWPEDKYEFEITITDPEAKVVVTDGEEKTEYYFESLEDAIAFAAENVPEGSAAEIILLTDIENIIVTGEADVTIELDGHTVTGTVSVDEDASLTIKGTGEMEAQIDVRGDLTIDGIPNYDEDEEQYVGQITIYPDDSIDVAEGGVLTIEGVVEIVLDGTDFDIGSTYVETEDGNTEIVLESGVVIGGDLTITVKGESTLSAEGGFTMTDDGSLTIIIEEGTLTFDTDGNAIETEITVGDGASLVAKDTSGSNEGRIDGTVTVEDGGYAAFEDETFADYFADEDDEDAAKLDIVFDGDAAAERMMESSANENGDRYYRTTTEGEHTAHGHSFDIIVTDGSGNYVHDFDASMSQITLHFTCLCGEELYYTVDLAEDDYYAAVLTDVDGDGNEYEYVFVRYSFIAEVVSASGATAWYPVTGTATLEMFERADNEMRRGTKDYFDTYYKYGGGGVKYYYGCDAPDCYSGGQDIYIYGTQRGIVIREDVPVTHYGLEEVVMEGTDHTIWHCTDCGRYFVDGNTTLTEGDAYDFSELEKELEREQIFNETRNELLEELYEKLTGCMGDSGTIMDAYNKAVEEISGWEYEFGGGSTEDCDEYLETLLSDMDDVIAEAEFTIAEENQKAMSEISLEDLFGDFFDEDGNLSEKYEGYYSEEAQQQIKELYETALQDLGNFGFSTDDVDVTDSDSRYSEYVDWLDEMYGAYVQRIADELKSVDVIKVDTHEELSDEETIFSYVSNEDGMSGVIKLIITKVDGGKLDKAIGKATVVSGDTGDSKMTEEEMLAALEGKSVIGVYDFKLWDTLSDVQVITFNGYYYVCLQLPEELQGRDDLQIVYLGDDGILEVYRTYVDLDAGCLYFTTTHFSQYIIMGVEEKDLMPPIIVLSVFGGMELIVLVILIAVFVVRKKKENVVEENAPAKKKLAGLGLLPLLAVIIPTGAVGIIIGLAVANALLIAGIIVFIYLILTKTGEGVVEYEMGSSDGNASSDASSDASASLQDGLASNCSAIDEAKRNNS